MMAGPHVRQCFSRAAPAVVIEIGGRGGHGGVPLGRVVARLQTDFDALDRAEVAVTNELNGLAEKGVGTLLRADLDDGLALGCFPANNLRFGEEVREGLFAIEVFVAPQGLERVQGVPVVGRGDDDGVEVFLSAQLAEVGVCVAAGECAAGFFGRIVRFDGLFAGVAA